MSNKIKIILNIFLILNLFNIALAEENFFDEAKKKFNEEKLEDSKFLFQRNIVFNPKHAGSYLYLAKIYNLEENERKEEKNLNTTLLLEPDNEEAMYMLINIELKKSNYSKVKDLTKNFTVICKKLCEKKKEIQDTLKNIEPKKESKQ
jgi:ABC-type Zn2+ transport system substrate-binding protein/surface adhesin